MVRSRFSADLSVPYMTDAPSIPEKTISATSWVLAPLFKAPASWAWSRQAVDHALEAGKTLVDLGGQMRQLVVQFHREGDEDAAAREGVPVLEIPGLVVVQEPLDSFQGLGRVFETLEALVPPGLLGLAQHGVEQVLFTFEMIVESAFGHAGGDHDVLDGGA